MTTSAASTVEGIYLEKYQLSSFNSLMTVLSAEKICKIIATEIDSQVHQDAIINTNLFEEALNLITIALSCKVGLLRSHKIHLY